MKNVIYVYGIEVFSYHGVFREENVLGQKFIFDVECNLNFEKAMLNDCLDDSVSYAEITEIVYNISKNNKYKLLEKLSFEITKELFLKFSLIDKIIIKINKPNAPIEKNFRECGVKLEITREEFLNIGY